MPNDASPTEAALTAFFGAKWTEWPMPKRADALQKMSAALTAAFPVQTAEIERLAGALQNVRGFVQAELEVRVDSHTLGGDMATLDETHDGIVGEAVGCLARIDAALAAPVADAATP